MGKPGCWCCLEFSFQFSHVLAYLPTEVLIFSFPLKVGTSHRAEGVDYALESIHNIKEALPELWEVAVENSESISYSGKVSIETSVIA